MEGQYNLRSPAVKRLMKEAQELRDATEQFYAQPLEDNLFEWHFTIRGPADTEFDGGIYHGRIVLPPEYPMKPPSIIILTPNGRFETHKKICLSISGYHPESWQPSWSLRTALLAIIGFMPTHGNGAIGSLDYTLEERKCLARKSQDWNCEHCGYIRSLVRPVTEASQALNKEAKELGSQITLQGEKEKPSTSESSESSSEANSSSTSTSTVPAAAAAAATPVPSAAQFAPFPNPLFFRPPFDPQMLMTGAATSTSAVPPMPCLSPFMPMHPAYAAGRMPFMPPMMPYFGPMAPPYFPPTGVAMPPYVPGPGGFPFMPPSTMFPAGFASVAPQSTVASSVTPTSVVWAGVAHPVPSATVQSSSASELRTSLGVQPSSASASSPVVTVSTSQSTVLPASTPSPAQVTAVTSASTTTSNTSHTETVPPTASTAADRDDDPVLSASELRRRQRTSSPVTMRTVRQPAELPARASSHISRLFGNVILVVLILCICLLLARRLYMIAGQL